MRFSNSHYQTHCRRLRFLPVPLWEAAIVIGPCLWLCVSMSVCLSICVQDNSWTRWHIGRTEWWAQAVGDTLDVWLNFGADPIPSKDPGSLFLSLPLWDRTFYDNLKHYSYSDLPTFTKFWKMTETSNRTYQVHFGVVLAHHSNRAR